MELLRETARPVTEICFDVGFNSLGTFSRTFRAVVGESPSQYRSRFGKPYFTGSVAIEPTRVGEYRAFRLLKGPGFIVVTEQVAEHLRRSDYRAVLLQPTTQYGGT